MNIPENIAQIERPDRSLMTYYALASLLAGPVFFVPLLVSYFRYHTLRYRFDDEGVSMSWGILFRREIHLTFARIQDIHLSSNLVERWLGLARIQIQTASGSSKAEMTIEGVPNFLEVRDFLYSRMRGAKPTVAPKLSNAGSATEDFPELAHLLTQTAEELRAIRQLLEQRQTAVGDPRP